MTDRLAELVAMFLDLLQTIETLQDWQRRRPIHIFLQNLFEVFANAIRENLDPMQLSRGAGFMRGGNNPTRFTLSHLSLMLCERYGSLNAYSEREESR